MKKENNKKQASNKEISKIDSLDYNKKSYIKLISQCILVFLITIIILTAILTISTMIPNKSIEKNMMKSSLSYKESQAFEFDKKHHLYSVADNYADVILLGVVWNMKDDSPFVTSLDTKYHDGNINEVDYGKNIGLYLNLLGEEPNTDYSRYWHGMSAFVRPLLLFTSIENIRIIGAVLAIILMFGCALLLIKKKYYMIAFIFVAGFMCVRIWDLSNALEYHSAVVIAIIMTILFILNENSSDNVILFLSVISGTLVAFFDFLTAETLTILVPLVILLLIKNKKSEIKEKKQGIALIIKSLLAWGISYGMTFITKWVLVSVVTKTNKIFDSINYAKVRTNGDTGEKMSFVKQVIYAVLANVSTLFGGTKRVDFGCIFVGLLISSMIIFSVYYLFRGEKFNKDITIILLMIAIVPIIRFMVLSNHSYLHEFFTYRSLAATIMAIFGIIGAQLDFAVFNKKRKSGGR